MPIKQEHGQPSPLLIHTGTNRTQRPQAKTTELIMTHNEVRENLIPALVDEGKDLNEINDALATIGQHPLGDAEVVMYGVTLKLDAATVTETVTKAETETKPKAKAKAAPKAAPAAVPVLQVEVEGATFDVQGAWNKKDQAIPVTRATVAAYQFVAGASAMLREVLGADWYAKYKAIKNPGFTKATKETREAAMWFTMRTMIALKAPADALKGEADG